MSQKSHVVFRNAHEGDMPYIMSSWVKSSKRGVPHTPWALHVANQNRIIDGLLRRGAAIMLAVDVHDSNQIFGWVCYERFIGEDRGEVCAIHWINTKKPYRNLGLAKLLLKSLRIDIRAPIIASTTSYIVYELHKRYKVVVVPQLLEGLGP